METDIDEIVKPYLEENEQILWRGRPDIKAFHWSLHDILGVITTCIGLFLILFFLYCMIAPLITHILDLQRFSMPKIEFEQLLQYLFAFIVYGGLIMVFFFWYPLEYFTLKNRGYFLTDKRIFIFDRIDKWQTGGTVYEDHLLDNVNWVNYDNYVENIGNVYFAYNDKYYFIIFNYYGTLHDALWLRHIGNFCFAKIHDGKNVAKLLISLVENHKEFCKICKKRVSV